MRVVLAPLVIVAALLVPTLGAPRALSAEESLRVRITSPMGRTGSFESVRVVAQIQGPAELLATPPVVRFLVDGLPIGEDIDGQPFAVEWVDDNPFERREISVEVTAADGTTAATQVVLAPLEVAETTDVLSVLLEAVVEDPKGKHVSTLERDAFHLLENGQPQSLDMVRTETLPATYLLLIDSSQSMARRIDFVKLAARRLTQYLRRDDRVVIVPFSTVVGTITGPTSDRDTILDAIGSIRAGGGTAIVDSLSQTAALLKGVPGRHAVVLLTDGYDEHSEHDWQDAIDSLKRNQITTYVVGIGGIAGVSIKGERVLRTIAKETAGRAFFPYRDTELPAIHDHIAEDVRQRYFITYTPTNQRRDGSWRAVALTVGDTAYKVRTRDGYFAPAPAPVRPVLEFTIVDTQNRYLEIGRDDLEVQEDGVVQAIESFQEAIAPVSIVLTLDQSGSMRRVADTVRDAAHRFVDALRPADSLAVTLFADAPALIQDLTKDREQAALAVDQYFSQGGTALFDALGLGFERLRHVQGRRALVLMTDGRDENDAGTAPGSIRPFAEILQMAREVDVTVYAIGLGPNVDRKGLESLANATGGLALFPTDVLALDGEYQRIVENLRRRYLLSYTSTNESRDGKWRTAVIRSRTDHAVVKSRGGYYAPDDGM